MKSLRFLLLTFVIIFPLLTFAATDNFDDDPVQSDDWELYEPKMGMSYELEDGWWQVTIPSGSTFDHWTTIDEGLQLRRDDMPEDFFIETRVRFLGSGDPLNPSWPPANESYMATLMVYFTPFDVFYWGPRRGTPLGLQRSGQHPPPCSFDPGLQDVYIGIRKAGTEYSFTWKENEEDPWQTACTQDAVETPVYVGFMFKSWNPLITVEETFQFDYFTISDLEEEAPEISPVCETEGNDLAWSGMPYIRHIATSGFPTPEVSITEGPDGMFYDPETKTITEWIPEDQGTVAVELEATNSAGTDSATWNVDVQTPSDSHEDDFDDDPRDLIEFWEFSEPQTGVAYSVVEEGDSNWWRLEVPQTGDAGQNFDIWTTVDRSVQLRHAIEDPDADFLIETKVKIDPALPPPFNDEFGAGLLVNFGGSDVLQWQVGQERSINFEQANIILERSGLNNIAVGFCPDFLQGDPVLLRLEKKCSTYNAFWKCEGEEQWRYAGSHQANTPPVSVGVLMKTWGDGATFTVDFDYFDIVQEGGGEDLVSVFTGDANSDGAVNLADAITILTYLFAGGTDMGCAKNGDVNDDGTINLADAITTLAYSFSGGTLTAPDDTDLTSQTIGCHKYPAEEVSDTGCEEPCTQ